MYVFKRMMRKVLSLRFIMAFLVFALFPALFVGSVLHGLQTGDSSVVLGAMLGIWISLFLFLMTILDAKGRL